MKRDNGRCKKDVGGKSEIGFCVKGWITILEKEMRLRAP